MPPHEASGGVPRWVVICGVTVVAVCFGVAYHSGASAQQRTDAVPLLTLRHQLDELSSNTATCGRQYAKASAKALGGKNASLLTALTAANATHDSLVRQEAEQQNAASRCSASLENQRNDIRGKRGQAMTRAMKLVTLQAKLDAISADITRVRGGLGMQRALLFDAMRALRKRHLKLLTKLGELMPVNVTEYDAELVDQYVGGNYTQPIKADDVANEFVQGADYHDVKVSKFLRNWREFRYDPAAHPDIYIPAEDAPTTNATMPAPRYFGRDSQGDESLGLALGPMNPPIRTTAFQFKAVVTVGLCALRHNNSNLTFPSKFRRVSEASTTEYLNETLQTPLVTFCRLCTSALRSALFRIACGRDRPRKLYGTYEFWAARSMVRPTQAVIDAARQRYAQLGLAGRNVLAVAFKNPPQLRQKCEQSRAPQFHYMWARAVTAGNASATLVEAVKAANRTEQCQPSRATLFDALETLRQRFKFDSILVSVESAEDEAFVRGSDFGGAAQVVAYRPTTAFEDMVDIVLASWADHVLLNRFSDHSQVVAEGFALRHRMDPSGRMHFF